MSLYFDSGSFYRPLSELRPVANFGSLYEATATGRVRFSGLSTRKPDPVRNLNTLVYV